MSTQVYYFWDDNMSNLNFTALGGEDGVLAVQGSVMVPDGLWSVTGAIDLSNDTDKYQLLDARLQLFDVGLKKRTAWDRRIVRLAPNNKADCANISLMVVGEFS